MTRRLLLSALTASAATAAAQQQRKPPIGIGFLGVSHSHGIGKLAAVRASPDFRLIGICESDPKLREKLRADGIALLERDQLLRHPEVRVIAVESAVRNHAADGLAVLEAGKHLHLEKAPADKMAAFEKVVDAVRRTGLALQIGYMWRYNPGMIKAIEAARSGWLGSVYLVRGSIGNQLPAAQRPEWAEFPGGTMFELGGHLIDATVRLMGKPRKVTPFLHTDGGFGDVLRDNTVAVLEWEKATGMVQSANLEPNAGRYRVFEIHGTNGCAILNPIEPPSLMIDLDKPAGPYPKGQQKFAFPPYQRFVDDFMELAAVVRGEARLGATLDEELIVEEALLRCSGMYG
jgi:predicted dehydrogenase